MSIVRRGIFAFTTGFQYVLVAIAILGFLVAIFHPGPVWGRVLAMLFWGAIGAIGLWNIPRLRAARRRADNE
jgi:hypothetical protein